MGEMGEPPVEGGFEDKIAEPPPAALPGRQASSTRKAPLWRPHPELQRQRGRFSSINSKNSIHSFSSLNSNSNNAAAQTGEIEAPGVTVYT